MVDEKAKVALQSFISGALITFSALYLIFFYLTYLNLSTIYYVLPTILFCFILIEIVFKEEKYGIALRAALLGITFSTGLFMKLRATDHINIFGAYMCVICIFHYTEFLVLALVDPKQVTVRSFVINHSPQYVLAAVSSWVEFFLENRFYPPLKQYYWVSNVGLTICICGEILRKVAMWHAGKNFNHLVQHRKASNHVLVTSGVYQLFRHPSYVGWFYWSIGTQIILCNPICVVAYAAASWFFFKERIYVEEITLLSFFGQDYCDYQARVGTGLPFIRGYEI